MNAPSRPAGASEATYAVERGDHTTSPTESSTTHATTPPTRAGASSGASGASAMTATPGIITRIGSAFQRAVAVATTGGANTQIQKLIESTVA